MEIPPTLVQQETWNCWLTRTKTNSIFWVNHKTEFLHTRFRRNIFEFSLFCDNSKNSRNKMNLIGESCVHWKMQKMSINQKVIRFECRNNVKIDIIWHLKFRWRSSINFTMIFVLFSLMTCRKLWKIDFQQLEWAAEYEKLHHQKSTNHSMDDFLCFCAVK